MLGEKDITILTRLRVNSRENLTRMSRATKIPVSTLHEKLRRFQGKLIRRNTIILNFKGLGYELRTLLLIKTSSSSRSKFEFFLKNSFQINNLFRINNGYDFLADVLFKDMNDFKEFIDELSGIGVMTLKEYFILEELKNENFLTQKAAYMNSMLPSR